MSSLRLSTEEFLNLPESSGVNELCGGIVYQHQPLDTHQKVAASLYSSLRLTVKTGIFRLVRTSVELDSYNVVQPDLFWVSDTNERCHLVDGKYWRGAPDLVIEILSPGMTRQDRQTKYQLYEKHGVREYWIVDASELYIEVYTLRDGRFERLGLYAVGEQLVSPILNGMTLSVDALLKS